MRKFYLIPMALGALTLASCSDTIYDEPVQEEYSKDFINQFGTIDPNQDWNVAEVKSVTVNPGSASEVKIYAKNGAAYKLVGHYKDVSGEQTLKFDAAKTCDEFVVVAGGKGQVVNNGGSVNFTSVATRGYDFNDRSNVYTVAEDYTTFTWDEVMSYANRLPEGVDNTGKGNITNFKVIAQSDRKVTVYPVFWDAMFDHVVGIYTKNSRGNITEYPIYRDKEGDDVQVYRNGQWTNVTWDHFKEPESGSIDTSMGIRSRGFTIDLPDGTEYGFYVAVYENGYSSYRNPDATFYSSAEDNQYTIGGDWWNPGEEVEEHHSVFMRTRIENGNFRTFLGFEDMRTTGNNAGDSDLNDFLLIIDPSPLIVDEDAQEWIIACEDLGDIDDYDFNDVVFSVSHTAGSTDATVTPLAAGGTLPAYIYYKDRLVSEQEVHEWIGIGDAQAPSGFMLPMLNTENAGKAGTPVTITVDDDFYIALTGDVDNMGGFSVQVVGDQTRQVTAPGRGEAPQMICVPAGWEWPYEKINIEEAYPEFGQWGQNYQTSEWYNYPADGKTLGNN